MKTTFTAIVVCGGFFAAPVLAFDACKFDGAGNVSTYTSELLGPDACVEFCAADADCIAWQYTPHNMNPDTVPGRCMAFDAVEGPEETSNGTVCAMAEG